MSNYAERLKAHLSAYKRDQLGISEDGVWRVNGRPYSHILPHTQQTHNILPGIRDDFWNYFERHKHLIGLHTDFHHLNSSQACGFNLLYPWLSDKALQPTLLGALGLRGEIAEWSFEHMPDQEEKTSVDCFLKLASGAQVLIEVKLTEGHFGLGVPNPSRLEKRTKTYLPRLVGKVRREAESEAVFFLNYQLFRNLSHLDIARGDQLLLVLPRANAFTWLQGEAFGAYLTPEAQRAVRLIAIEDLVKRLRDSSQGSAKAEQNLSELCDKYAFASVPVVHDTEDAVA